MMEAGRYGTINDLAVAEKINSSLRLARAAADAAGA